jgi:hypothetical protein
MLPEDGTSGPEGVGTTPTTAGRVLQGAIFIPLLKHLYEKAGFDSSRELTVK